MLNKVKSFQALQAKPVNLNENASWTGEFHDFTKGFYDFRNQINPGQTVDDRSGLEIRGEPGRDIKSVGDMSSVGSNVKVELSCGNDWSLDPDVQSFLSSLKSEYTNVIGQGWLLDSYFFRTIVK